MAQSVGPTFIPKAVLTTGRVLHQPFEVPTELTKSALDSGSVVHEAIGALNKTAASAVEQLQPRGPAKLLMSLFGRVDNAIVTSTEQAKKATELIWVPLSNGSHQIGHAVSNPFALFYAKRAGFEIPENPEETQALLASITDPDPSSTKFPGANWPAPKADDGGGDSGGDGERKPDDTGGTDPGKQPDGSGDGSDHGKQPDGSGDGEQKVETTDADTAGTNGVTDPEATPGASQAPDGAQPIADPEATTEAPAPPTPAPVDEPAPAPTSPTPPPTEG